MEQDKVKRDDGSHGVWIFAAMSLCCIALGILGLYAAGFDWIGFVVWALFTGLIVTFTVILIPGEEHVKTTGFIIYEYERWNTKKLEYEKKYVYFTETLRAKFIFHKQVGTYILSVTEEEVNEKLRPDDEDYSFLYEYNTEEEAMDEIIKEVKRLIANDKIKDEISIRGIKITRTYNVEELKAQITSEELKNDVEKEG